MLGFLGGTGPEGKGLALRYAIAGETVIIGSRDSERAANIARELSQIAPELKITGAGNLEVAGKSDVVFITVPYEGQKPLLGALEEALVNKLVINVVAPLSFEKGRANAIKVDEGSAAEQAQSLLPRSVVIGAFQNLSATQLLDPNHLMQGDVVVCGADKEAKTRVMEMVGMIKDLRAVDGGGLQNARYVEELTALILNINRIYKAHATIRIVGI